MPPDPPYGWIAFGASIFSRLRTPSHYAPRYLQFSQMSLKVRKFVYSGYH